MRLRVRRSIRAAYSCFVMYSHWRIASIACMEAPVGIVFRDCSAVVGAPSVGSVRQVRGAAGTAAAGLRSRGGDRAT